MATIAIMMILSTVAVQAWSDVARRDAEAEMIFRAQDIVRAIKRFQTDRGRLPTEMKELLEVGQRRPQYFLRQLWKDPLVKDGKWQLIYANPAGGFIDPSVPVPGTPGAGSASTDAFGQPASVIKTEGFGGAQPIGGPGAPGDFTGMPIAGVKSKCTKRPFRKYKDKTSYSEWIFTIFDLDPRGAAAPLPGQPGGAVPGAANPGTTSGPGATFPPVGIKPETTK